MSAIGGGLGLGAGVGVSSVLLAPFNSANTFMGSAFFGYGMILGERYAYQADWPKIQARLENGEKIENIIQEYTGRFTAVVMKEAEIIFNSVTQTFNEIMKKSLENLVVDESVLEHLLHGHVHFGNVPPGETPPPPPPPTDEPIDETGGGTIGGVTLPPTEVPKTETLYTFNYFHLKTGMGPLVPSQTKATIIKWTAGLISDISSPNVNPDSLQWKNSWINAVIAKWPEWWPQIKELIRY